MSWSDAELTEALRALPTPAPPPADLLLARAFPEDTAPARLPALAYAAAALAVASLPVWLPGSRAAHLWHEGVVRRGVELTGAVLDHYDPEDL